MPFCLHLNMLIFKFFFSEFKMILFPLFCLFFFTRISAENLCLTWLFLSTEASPVVGRAPSHWAELGVWCPLFIPKRLPVEAPPKTGKCSEMHDSHSHRPVRKMHTEKILTWSPREHQVLFRRVCFVPGCFEVVCTKPREFKSLQQFLNSSLLSKTQSSGLCCWSTLGQTRDQMK